MLLAIHNRLVQGYDSGQDSIIYLVSTAQAAENEGVKFVFTDGHGIMAITDFFDNLGDLSKIDWDWANTQEDGDRKRRRQAEFLIHSFCPWELIEAIAVKDATTKARVLKLIDGAAHKPDVQVMAGWYY